MMWFFVSLVSVIGFAALLDWRKNKVKHSPHHFDHPDNSSVSSSHYYSGESSSSDCGGGGGGGD